MDLNAVDGKCRRKKLHQINVEHIVKCSRMQKVLCAHTARHRRREYIDSFVTAFEKKCFFSLLFHFVYGLFIWCLCTLFPNRFTNIKHTHITHGISSVKRINFFSHMFKLMFTLCTLTHAELLFDEMLRQKKCLWCKRSHQTTVKCVMCMQRK